jgi:protein-disulfide isomerase
MSTEQLTPAVNDGDHVDGPADAPITLVEFGDFECEYCGEAYPILKDLRQRFEGQLRFVFRNFPLRESHPHAEHAAEAAEAAGDFGGDDAYWAMHDALYENQQALEDEDLAAYGDGVGVDGDALLRAIEAGTYRSRVRDDFKSGVRSGVNGTPSFFINGERFDGNWQDAETFASALSERRDSSVRPARRGV